MIITKNTERKNKMAWRTVLIENPAKLSLKDNKLVIKQEHEIHVPLEDIDTLVLDSGAINLTQKLLGALGRFTANVVICDEKHLPTSMITPYSHGSRGAKIARTQLSISMPLKKQLWQKNITRKIMNQAMVLKKHGHTYEDLIELSKTVRSGDVSNNEATAARLYFERLLQDSTRRQPTWYNSALDYGYAIVRSEIARTVAARGLIAAVGINHHSELNQYNLVDDLIETLRPLVDDYVLTAVAVRHVDAHMDDILTREDRHLLIDIINQYGIILDKKYKIRDVVNIMVDSFIEAINQDSILPFQLPELIK